MLYLIFIQHQAKLFTSEQPIFYLKMNTVIRTSHLFSDKGTFIIPLSSFQPTLLYFVYSYCLLDFTVPSCCCINVHDVFIYKGLWQKCFS